jgi:hypothetical protein
VKSWTEITTFKEDLKVVDTLVRTVKYPRVSHLNEYLYRPGSVRSRRNAIYREVILTGTTSVLTSNSFSFPVPH